MISVLLFPSEIEIKSGPGGGGDQAVLQRVANGKISLHVHRHYRLVWSFLKQSSANWNREGKESIRRHRSGPSEVEEWECVSSEEELVDLHSALTVPL